MYHAPEEYVSPTLEVYTNVTELHSHSFSDRVEPRRKYFEFTWTCELKICWYLAYFSCPVLWKRPPQRLSIWPSLRTCCFSRFAESPLTADAALQLNNDWRASLYGTAVLVNKIKNYVYKKSKTLETRKKTRKRTFVRKSLCECTNNYVINWIKLASDCYTDNNRTIEIR